MGFLFFCGFLTLVAVVGGAYFLFVDRQESHEHSKNK